LGTYHQRPDYLIADGQTTVQRLTRKEAEQAQLVKGVDVYPDHPGSSPVVANLSA